MIDTLKQIAGMKAALGVNAFCYYFKRLWLIGRLLPEDLYSRYGLKKGLPVAAVILRQLADVSAKPLYQLVIVVLPLLPALAGGRVAQGQGAAAMVQILFFLNCVLGAFGDSQIFTVTRDKVVCIKHMRLNARSYVQGYLAFKYLPFFAYYLPWLLVFARLLGGTLLQGFFAWLMLLSFRMLGEAFQLFVFDRTGRVISRSMAYSWAMIALGLAGAYLPLALGGGWPLAAVLLHPACAALYTLSGGAALWYITLGYRGYESKFHRSIDLNFLLATMLKSSSSATAVKEVEMQEKDAAVPRAKEAKLRALRGYSYLNALFFARHRRQLVKPVYYRLAAAGALFAAGVVFFFVNRGAAVQLSRNLAARLPLFIYIMYFMTVADKAGRAMFYNCDKDMLRYAWYRRPQTILKNFRIRLVRVALYDLAIAAAVCLAAAGFCLLCGAPLLAADFLLFCAAVLLLSVLFTAHHLCLYYIFQPYSESLKVKNPFYSAVNLFMYTLCFLCLQIKVGGLAFTLAVLGFTVLYIAGALALVYRLAPRTFRVK